VTPLAPNDVQDLVFWYSNRHMHNTFYGIPVMLNLARPVTKWRLFRNWIGWIEKDSMRGHFINKST
jgi:hypothetical protein